MVDVLDMQVPDDDIPSAPAEEKMSMGSVVQCHHSGVSVLMCQMLRR